MEKWHAAVARSTFASQNVQNIRFYGLGWCPRWPETNPNPLRPPALQVLHLLRWSTHTHIFTTNFWLFLLLHILPSPFPAYYFVALSTNSKIYLGNLFNMLLSYSFTVRCRSYIGRFSTKLPSISEISLKPLIINPVMNTPNQLSTREKPKQSRGLDDGILDPLTTWRQRQHQSTRLSWFISLGWSTKRWSFGAPHRISKVPPSLRGKKWWFKKSESSSVIWQKVTLEGGMFVSFIYEDFTANISLSLHYLDFIIIRWYYSVYLFLFLYTYIYHRFVTCESDVIVCDLSFIFRFILLHLYCVLLCMCQIFGYI